MYICMYMHTSRLHIVYLAAACESRQAADGGFDVVTHLARTVLQYQTDQLSIGLLSRHNFE